MANRQIQRSDTAANWSSVNPVLSRGEFGYETDTGKLKMGDGTTAWNSLGYLTIGEAAELLTRIKTVDGASSGLDADLLDGNHASAFAVSGHNHSGTYIDIPANSAQGDILYRDGSSWTRLAAGTAGYGLQTNGASANPTWANKREVLTADRTYYVATTGSDSNDGLAVGTPFLTIQKALNVIQATLDVAGYTVTVQLANGTYASLTTGTGFVGGGTVHIKGDETTPSNVLVERAAGGLFVWSSDNQGTWIVSGMKLVATTATCIYNESFNQGVTVKAVDFGASSNHVYAVNGGKVTLENYTISGGAANHIFALYSGMILSASRTVTISNTPAFSTAFCNCSTDGFIRYQSATFTGSATGKRYQITTNGTVFTNTGTTYFPGDVAGTTATGGQYA